MNNNTIILNTITGISFNKFMREQGLFILNLIVNGKLLPLQFIQTKDLHLCADLYHIDITHKASDNKYVYFTESDIENFIWWQIKNKWEEKDCSVTG